MKYSDNQFKSIVLSTLIVTLGEKRNQDNMVHPIKFDPMVLIERK